MNLEQDGEAFKKGAKTVQLKGGRSYVAEFTELAKVIRGEKKFAWSYQHDLDVHETLLKICGMD